MPRYGQFVVGPAGCGKSTYCATIQRHCETVQRSCRVVNLDPAAEYFEYTPSADIRDLIQVDDTMQDEELNLGPNGGLIFCMEYLCQNLNWVDEALGEDELDYILFDCPGQIELYSHLSVFPRLIEYLQQKWDFRVVSVFILDARFLVDGSHFLSGILSALSAMVCLGTPHVNVMTKLDMLSEDKQKLISSRYLQPELDELCETSGDEGIDEKAAPRKFSRLTRILAGLVERYSLVQFQPLNRDKEETIEDLLFQIDQCLQYGEDNEPMNRFFDQAERDLAVYQVTGEWAAGRQIRDYLGQSCSGDWCSLRHGVLIETSITIAGQTRTLEGSVFWIISSMVLPESKSHHLMIESALFSALIAVIVDIDHFIAAGSFSLKAARSLPGRPFLHWSGCLVVLAMVLLVGSCIIQHHWSTAPCLVRQTVGSGWVTLVAWSSHQLRDSLRRGLWLWPPPRLLLSPPGYLHTLPLPLPLAYPLALASILTLLHITPLKLQYCYAMNYPTSTRLLGVSAVGCFMRYKGSSSQWWLERQRRDPYVRQARVQSYRCRSAFKLLQMNKTVGSGGLIRPGAVVVDCGAAPGSWTQVAVELAAPGGTVVALDLLDFESVPGAHCLSRLDLRQTAQVIHRVREVLGADHCVDVVLSDIAPPASGLGDLDHLNLIHLVHCVLQLALHVSRPGADLLVKLWSCPEVTEFKSLLEHFYRGPRDSVRGSSFSPAVRLLKPDASRKDSAEIYVCARGLFLPSSHK
ncbi:GPN-loop GTPase 3 [Taenia crassiceps]|uniref:GPN-loop GTPase 3 n=1 Tax=Taenia crassiceps TaxID=6207 RepID=A0ABR4QSE6_9CEST